MSYFAILNRLITISVAVCFLALVVPVRGQKMSEGPITKDNLLSALESMQARKSKRKSAAWYVAMLKEHKVNFQLTPEDEQKIRRVGKYLGQKGLDSLVNAVRDNYVAGVNQQPPSTKEGEKAMPDEKSKSQELPRSISQTMTNSPGGIQAGGNVTINQGAWLMTGDEQNAIIQVLQTHSPATIYLLMIGDSDARRYASQIAYAIQKANWHFEPVNFALMMPGVFGVHIRMSDPNLKATVVSAFKAAGIPTTEGPGIDSQYPNAILVGLKP